MSSEDSFASCAYSLSSLRVRLNFTSPHETELFSESSELSELLEDEVGDEDEEGESAPLSGPFSFLIFTFLRFRCLNFFFFLLFFPFSFDSESDFELVSEVPDFFTFFSDSEADSVMSELSLSELLSSSDLSDDLDPGLGFSGAEACSVCGECAVASDVEFGFCWFEQLAQL